jgi:SAM-dependent methyltransferase
MEPKQFWNEKHGKYAQQDWITKPTIFATQVISYFPKSGKILELGCGQGQDTLYFLQHGFEVVACDFSQTALDFAKLRIPEEYRNKVEFKQLDMSTQLPFLTESIDVVYSHLALHYFDSHRTQALFNEIHTVLKPGGIFATLTNTIEDPEVGTAKKVDEEFFESGGINKRFFSVDSMGKYASKFELLILDAHGETHKDEIKTLIRLVGKK